MKNIYIFLLLTLSFVTVSLPAKSQNSTNCVVDYLMKKTGVDKIQVEFSGNIKRPVIIKYYKRNGHILIESKRTFSYLVPVLGSIHDLKPSNPDTQNIRLRRINFLNTHRHQSRSKNKSETLSQFLEHEIENGFLHFDIRN